MAEYEIRDDNLSESNSNIAYIDDDLFRNNFKFVIHIEVGGSTVAEEIDLQSSNIEKVTKELSRKYSLLPSVIRGLIDSKLSEKIDCDTPQNKRGHFPFENSVRSPGCSSMNSSLQVDAPKVQMDKLKLQKDLKTFNVPILDKYPSPKKPNHNKYNSSNQVYFNTHGNLESLSPIKKKMSGIVPSKKETTSKILIF